MISCLWNLSKAVATVGVKPTHQHRNLKKCPRTSTLYIELDENADIETIRFIPKLDDPKLRKWETTAGISFPSFNVIPLDIWNDNHRKNINKCLALSGDIVEKLNGVPPQFEAFVALCNRAKKLTAEKLYDRLLSFAEAELEETDDQKQKDILTDFLAASIKKINKMQIILDIADKSKFEYPPHHKEIQDWLNKEMLKSEKHDESDGEDMFGNDLTDAADTFPSVDLPILGPTKLYAVNKNAPCLMRYGRIGPQLCPIGETSRKEMKFALEWITDASRRGKTWTNLRTSNGHSTILIVYVSEMSIIPEIANLFARSDKSEEKRFEANAMTVIESVQKTIAKKTDAKLSVFAISRIDQGTIKTVADRIYEANRIIIKTKEWQQACKNIPFIRLRIPRSKGAEPIWIRPVIPYVFEIVDALNIVFAQDEIRLSKKPSLSVGEILDLFFQDGQQKWVVGRAARLAAENSVPLLAALAHADRCDKPIKITRRRDISLIISILGLLLYKSKIYKEKYMTDTFFLMGRLLSLTDLLHAEYCKHVRDNQRPPQLLGNSVFRTVFENPRNGLVELFRRLPIYQAWVESGSQNRDNNQKRLGGWAVGEIRKIAAQLKTKMENPPQKTNDVEKIQISLGYLASNKKGEKNEQNDQSN